mmetsp:Transcript_6091/g.14140  ORF Transcript_6091/g.14140 Transcript_6091/m.14140 type:complete len:372 (-) Transcript_6091:613-1728(-)|eukprot:CAMPEP_0206453946 /NCGR_PEP_ID=MMETSP0324_2-20121206/20849_1 /ASSEMBLY_ACC=CAM_ASM_000836 /TAXON_ID=2866 /ORGANISM="Crypthecodinium cohnii, Strain Seligo" /LENGTH=371 /DNA_ID=CAMNT_0053924335 /DNA_START=156 /DNA_END=1271 /DNA_ORIENTATION=-
MEVELTSWPSQSTQGGSPLLGFGSPGGPGAYRNRRIFSAAEQTKQEVGCLSWTNSFVLVPQDRFYAVEKFGKFERLLPPGLSWSGLDLCGCCIGLRSISNRVTEVRVEVRTKTKDHVFATVKVAVQKTVMFDGIADAMYKLTDVYAQVEAYVADVIRSQVPKMSVNDLFEDKDTLGQSILLHLHAEMREYGLEVLRALVVDIIIDREVAQAMNEIKVQQYHRDATLLSAESDQIRLVRCAEGHADAAALYGEGMARQRAAILKGLEDTVDATGEQMSADELTHLMILTNWFETLSDVAQKCEDQLVYISHDPKALGEAYDQVLEAMNPKSAGGMEKGEANAPPKAAAAAAAAPSQESMAVGKKKSSWPPEK